MFAPQYPNGLRLDIYSHTLVGGNGGQDIKEINLLNHYIGMHDLAVEDFTEFKWMPFVLGGLALLFLRAAVLGHGQGAAWTRPSCSSTSGRSRCGRSATSSTGYGHELSPHGRRQGAGVHAADVRLPEDRELRGLLVPASGHLSHGRRRAPPAARCGWRGVRAIASRPAARHPMLPALLLVMLAVQDPAQVAAPAPPTMEGRPAAADTSPLQRRIDATPAGGSIDIEAGTYEGDLIIDRPLQLIGRGRPRLVGSGHGSVIRVRADDVRIEGFDIDGREGGDLSRDSSGHSRGRPARHDPRLPHRPIALRHLPA